jgi:hypothetical protein
VDHEKHKMLDYLDFLAGSCLKPSDLGTILARIEAGDITTSSQWRLAVCGVFQTAIAYWSHVLDKLDTRRLGGGMRSAATTPQQNVDNANSIAVARHIVKNAENALCFFNKQVCRRNV